jgi:hypothetical protein
MTSRLAVYDGRNVLATVTLIRERFEARDAKRRLIGRFKSVKRAVAAIDRRIKARCDG